MADEVKIGLKITGKQELRDFREGMKEWRNALRLLELEFKKGKISGGEYQKAAGELSKALKQFEDGTGRTATAQNALWHANNRVTLGFKSLATEVTGIHNKMRPATDRLREFYREQRVGDRTMREGVSTVQMFSGVLGGEVSGAVGQAANAFQQAEFAVNSLGIAAQSSTGKMAALGTAIRGLAVPLSAVTAIGIGEFMLINSMLDRMESSLNRIRRAQGMMPKQERSWFMELLSKAGGPSGNLGIQTVSAMARGVLAGETAAFAAENQIVMDEVVAIGKLTDAKKEHLDVSQKFTDTFNRDWDAMRGISAAAGRSIRRDRGFMHDVKGRLPMLPGLLDPGIPQFKEAKKEVSSFEQAAKGSFERVGNTISQSIGKGFVDAFGIGHTLLGQFINEFISSFLSLTASKIVSKIFPFAAGGTIYEPIVGRGMMSGKTYTFGERGPERITPMGSYAKDAGRSAMGGTTIVIRGDFRYDHIAWAVDKGNQIRSLRTV